VGKLIVDPCVEEDLWAIWQYVAQDNPAGATRLVEAVYATFKDLLATPGLGRPRRFRDRRLRDVRSWRVSGFRNCLIFYRVVPEGVQVLHVYHGARGLDALFEE